MGSSGEVEMNHNPKILNRACSTKVQLQTVEKETYLGNQGAGWLLNRFLSYGTAGIKASNFWFLMEP